MLLSPHSDGEDCGVQRVRSWHRRRWIPLGLHWAEGGNVILRPAPLWHWNHRHSHAKYRGSHSDMVFCWYVLDKANLSVLCIVNLPNLHP